MTDVRIERAHRYEWWRPGESVSAGTAEVFPVGGDFNDKCVLCDLKVTRMTGAAPDDAVIITLTHSSIPAVIAALQSYQDRIGASENEEA